MRMRAARGYRAAGTDVAGQWTVSSSWQARPPERPSPPCATVAAAARRPRWRPPPRCRPRRRAPGRRRTPLRWRIPRERRTRRRAPRSRTRRPVPVSHCWPRRRCPPGHAARSRARRWRPAPSAHRIQGVASPVLSHRRQAAAQPPRRRRSRSTDVKGANGNPLAPSSRQPPISTRTLAPRDRSANSWTRRDFPTPASPPIMTTDGRPPHPPQRARREAVSPNCHSIVNLS